MGLVVSITAALSIWIVLWAFDVKAIDGIILALVIVFTTIGAQMVTRYLPGDRPS